MDGNIGEMLNNILANPDMLKKVLEFVPVITQAVGNSQPIQTTLAQPEPAEQIKPAPPPSQSSPDALSTAVSTIINALSGPKEAAAPAFSNAAPTGGEGGNSSSAPASGTEPPVSETFDIERALKALKGASSATTPEKDHRVKLLLALKPFLKEGRQTKIDLAIKYMSAAKIFNMIGKNGFI